MDVYENARVIGAGSFGIVVACRDKQTKEDIALKIASLDRAAPNQAAKSLIREQTTLAKLDHPNIIKI